MRWESGWIGLSITRWQIAERKEADGNYIQSETGGVGCFDADRRLIVGERFIVKYSMAWWC